MVGYSAVNCKNTTEKGYRMFRFPMDPERKRIWMANSKRADYNQQSAYRLCQEHFEDDQFENNREDNWKKLKPDAVPTLFNIAPSLPVKIVVKLRR